MKQFLILLNKELSGYFNSLMAYIFIVVFLVASTILFLNDFFLVGQATTRQFFEVLPWFFILLLPALSMNIWSVERKNGTIEILSTLPISTIKVIYAKFFASWIFVGIILLFSVSLPLFISHIGELDWGPVAAGYIGALLLGGAYMALGQWVSILFKSQIISFVITVLFQAVFLLLGASFFTRSVGVLEEVLFFVSTQSHYANFTKGLVVFADFVYFLTVMLVFLGFTYITLEKRKYE
jgi:ABC-2 type transport system permease protein